MDKFASKYFFLIPLLVVLVYANSLGNGFVLDDPSQVANNAAVTSFNLPGIFFGSSFGVGGGTEGIYYKPMMSSSYAVLYHLFGSGAWSFHLLQVLLQAANGIIVFYIFRKFFKSGLAFWLALVFVLHPFNSEAVLYISNLQDVLFFFFGGLAFLVASWKQEQGRSLTKVGSSSRSVLAVEPARTDLFFLRALLCGILVLFSMLSKETGIVFIPVIVLYTVFFNFGKKQRWEAYWLFVALGTAFGFYFLLRFAAVGLPVGLDHPYPIMRLTLGERLVNIPAIGFYYVRNFFAPHDFAVAQHWVVKAVNWNSFWLPLLVDAVFVGVIGGIGVVVWRVRNNAESKKRSVLAESARTDLKQGFSGWRSAELRGKLSKGRSKDWDRPCLGLEKVGPLRGNDLGEGPTLFYVYLFFLGWFVCGMLLHLNIFPLDVTVADRWFYFPSVGLLGIIGVFAMSFGKRSVLYAGRTLAKDRPCLGLNKGRSFTWEDPWLRTDLVLITAAAFLVLVLSARTFVRVFDWRDGITLATREVKYSKSSFPLENNLAYELINAGRYQEALVHAKRSTALGPWWWLNWNNLGVIYRHLGYVQKDPKLIEMAIVSFGKGADNTDVFLLPYENRAEMLLNYRSPKETIDYIVGSSKKVGTGGRLLFLLALALSQTEDTKGAIDVAYKAYQALPGDPRAEALYQGLVAGKKVQIEPTAY